jgi:predicted extracellular nuclease
MPNAPRLASRHRLFITLIAALFASSVFLHQMYFAPRAQAVSTSIVISQVYGGGGNSGATYTHDFVELFNRGNVPVSIAGWSIQYTSATGTGNFGANSGQITELPAVTINPGQYFLVQEASQAAVGAPLPTADQVDPTPIPMAGGAGKVALVNTTAPLGCNGGSTPCSAAALATIVDLIGYGSANFFEGAAAAPTLSNTTSAFRGDGGCVDTDNNNTDFAAATPAARNTASPLHPCTGPPSLSINDVSVTEGDSGTVTASFKVSLSSAAPIGGVTFNIATADDSATDADNDYEPRSEIAQTIPAGSTEYDFDVTVNGDTNIESNETFVVNVTGIIGASNLSDQGVGTITNDDVAPPVFEVVISQVYGGGGNSGATLKNDFIELYNRGTTTVSLSGWSVQYASPGGSGWQVTPLTGSMPPGTYYLIQEAAGAGGSVNLPTPDATGGIMMGATGGRVALSSSTTAFTTNSCPAGGTLVDLVGYGNTTCHEGAGPTNPTSNTTAALRKRGGCLDTNNNAVDFSIGSPNPRNSSVSRSCDYIAAAIHDIQGSGLTTPFLGQDMSTSGVVTGIKSNGFFIQESDAGVDANPSTSEGIFVFTSSAPAVSSGDLVSIKGTASEFFNLTQLESTLPGDVTVNTTGNALPNAVTLTTTILDPAGPTTQLERFEGMRMHGNALRSVGPTNEFGETFTVLDGVVRPMREPGIEISEPIPPDPTSGVPDCCIPQWDKNPERIMIDWDGLAGSSVVNVTSNVAITNVTGPLDFTFSNYKILPTSTPTVGTNISAVPVPTPATGEFTVASYNIENFTGAETQKKKAALAIRTVLHYPDVIGHVEIGSLAALQALATQVNNDAVAAGDSDPMYTAHLIPFSGTQHVGFLVKSSRVQVDSVTQERTGDTFIDPNTGLPATLHDRPPLVLRATFDPSGGSPREVIVVVNHLRSFIDIEGVSGEGPRVRAKRKAQGEAIAELLEELQTDNPGLPVISVGDYNAYQFNDGYTDPIATIKGSPTADDQVVVDASPDLVDPNYENLTDGLPADQRYSFIFEGTPQALDHVIVNSVASSYVTRYHVARNNSDFPDAAVYTTDATRPERNSDHDMPVAYFDFPPTITLTTNEINLSPPNHSYRTVTMSDMVASAADAGDPNITIDDVVITQVTSDELENAPGSTDGNTVNDIVIAGDCKSVQLRAERNASLDGRVYTVTLQVTDAGGNVTTATRKITVRISPGFGAAIDSGPVYTVNSACP